MARNFYENSPVAVEKRRTVRRIAEYESRALAKIAESFNGLSRREIRTRDNTVNWKDEKVWEKIRSQGCYHKSDEIIISCGTVTINKAEGSYPSVLVVYNNRIGIYQLPKGRKNIGEGYLDAAIRETTEETGISVCPLRLRFGTRATPHRSAIATGAAARSCEDLRSGVTRSLSNDTIGVSECTWHIYRFPGIQRMRDLRVIADVFTIDPDPATGAWRNIHWYAAKPCDSIERDEAHMPIPDDRDKFSTFWFSETEALSRLKLDDEKFMVRVAFEYTRNMSTDDWLSNKKFEATGEAGINKAGVF